MSTPINQLGLNSGPTSAHDSTMFNNMTDGNVGNNNDSLVDDLLNTIESQQTMLPPGTSYQNDINASGFSHMTDGQAGVPPPMNPNAHSMLESEYTRPTQSMAPGGSLANAVNSKQSLMFGDNDNSNTNRYGAMEGMNNDGKTYVEKLFDKLKPILVVFILMFVLSLHQSNRFIFGFVPQLLLENGQISVYGMLLKALLAAVLYYVILLLI
jgi:hypothetical protein